MVTSVNSGSRLDRLPIGPFHRRIMLLIGIGMFFDGFDIYLAGTVLGVTLKTGFSTLPQNAAFISAPFVGMRLGPFGTGFLVDRFRRRWGEWLVCGEEAAGSGGGAGSGRAHRGGRSADAGDRARGRTGPAAARACGRTDRGGIR